MRISLCNSHSGFCDSLSHACWVKSNCFCTVCAVVKSGVPLVFRDESGRKLKAHLHEVEGLTLAWALICAFMSSRGRTETGSRGTCSWGGGKTFHYSSLLALCASFFRSFFRSFFLLLFHSFFRSFFSFSFICSLFRSLILFKFSFSLILF